MSRRWDTRGSSTRPDATMYQPIAPCRPPSANTPASFHPSRASMRRAPPEPEERHEKDEPDRPAEQAMEVLPPEDALELGERHALVDQLVLGRLPVLVEHRLPVGLGERRDRADERLPLDDRQPGVGEAGDAPDDDHRRDRERADEEPGRDRAAGGRRRGGWSE